MDPVHESSIDTLIARDRHLAGVVGRAGRPPPFRREPGFATVLLLILEQQVSLASAAAAFRRLCALRDPTPKALLSLDDATLRSVGFSRQKTRYAKALAATVMSGTLRFELMDSMTDEEVRSTLTTVPGIGPWTADVYLLSCLGRPDIWPVGDRALRVGTGEVLGLDAIPDEAALREIGERWRPLRSTAAQLIWHDYLARRRTGPDRENAHPSHEQ
jgi:DNA-3-methyladenine glycosylase II